MKHNIFQKTNLGMFLLFLFSMAVQYNDPDPLFWMVIYGGAAIVCLLFALHWLLWQLSLGVGGVALLWALVLLPRVLTRVEELSLSGIFGAFGMKTLAIELARELGGLGMVALWMGILTKKAHGAASFPSEKSG